MRAHNVRVTVLSEGEWELLELLAARIAPDCASFDTAGWQRFRSIIGGFLAERPAAVRRLFRTFLKVLRWAPACRYGRRLDRLDPRRQDAVLRFLQEAPIRKLRQGLWGVKAVVFMGVFAQPEVAPALHYTPSFRGDEMLHA